MARRTQTDTICGTGQGLPSRWPCSQAHNVRLETPKREANSVPLRPSLLRLERSSAPVNVDLQLRHEVGRSRLFHACQSDDDVAIALAALAVEVEHAADGPGHPDEEAAVAR